MLRLPCVVSLSDCLRSCCCRIDILIQAVSRTVNHENAWTHENAWIAADPGSGAAALGMAVVAWGLSGIGVARPPLVSQTFREAGRPATWSCLASAPARA